MATVSPETSKALDELKHLLVRQRASNDEQVRLRREAWDRHIASLKSPDEVQKLFGALGADAAPW